MVSVVEPDYRRILTFTKPYKFEIQSVVFFIFQNLIF